jgi:hypothetical protein
VIDVYWLGRPAPLSLTMMQPVLEGNSCVGEHYADLLLRSPSRRMFAVECFRPCDEHALCRGVVEPIDFPKRHGPGKHVDAAALTHSVEESEIFREPVGVLQRI